ncbi:MAG: hypothetical protein HN809_11195 [Rhodospirillaceae bacterium]|nr:hypothetical protein [Rhodospirillaceae bacterium]
MSNRLALLGMISVALAAGPAVAADSNPWRVVQPAHGTVQMSGPGASETPQREQKPPLYGGYTFAPINTDATKPRTTPYMYQGPARQMPLAGTQPGYGYGAPYGGYSVPLVAGIGHPAGLGAYPGYPGGLGLGGYPGGLGGLGGYPGYPGGLGGYPGGWGGNGLNGLSGRFSWMPFW